MFILLEYKNKSMSGKQGDIAVWEYGQKPDALLKMGELAENHLPLELFEAKSVVMFH